MTKVPTAAEIVRMKARGYDRETIRQAEELLARYENDILPLQTQIREAFADVRLGDGVGLRQARALDDHWDDEIAVRARRDDETMDWTSISVETLLTFQDTLSFFDAEGMRFHLPAFLLAETTDDGANVMFHLTYRDDRYGKFRLLSPAQRRVVRSFLLLALQDKDYFFHHVDIRRALDEHWTD